MGDWIFAEQILCAQTPGIMNELTETLVIADVPKISVAAHPETLGGIFGRYDLLQKELEDLVGQSKAVPQKRRIRLRAMIDQDLDHLQY